MNRREFLQRSAFTGGTLLFSAIGLPAAVAGGRFVGLVDFVEEGLAPVGTLIATELDARKYTDLSRISETRKVTPISDFYIRTAASSLLPDAAHWSIKLDGLVSQPFSLDMHALGISARPMGTHLMECAGNVRQTHFGLISVAEWTGVPLMEVLDRAKPKPEASYVVVSGFDEYVNEPQTSIAGASWAFPLEILKKADAFLATRMNGQPLTRDHGAPVRLLVPGWYGCSCMKWVNHITFADDSVEATSQMREFAARTLQNGIPEMAKDYSPATIDHASMPVRVEKWAVGGKVRYRVVGILWGGSQLVKILQIRFNPDEEYVPVTGFHQTKDDPWTVWTHEWLPKAAGTYSIRLAIADPPVQARKMDAGYYVRTVEIREV